MCICALLCEACEHDSRRGRQMSWGRSCKRLRQGCPFVVFHLFAYYSYASIRDLSVSLLLLPFSLSPLSSPIQSPFDKILNVFSLSTLFFLHFSLGVYVIDISLGQVRPALKSLWVLTIQFTF